MLCFVPLEKTLFLENKCLDQLQLQLLSDSAVQVVL